MACLRGGAGWHLNLVAMDWTEGRPGNRAGTIAWYVIKGWQQCPILVGIERYLFLLQFRMLRKNHSAMAASLYHQLLDVPNLKLLMDRLHETLAAEAKKREEFYEWLTPDVKAEFINGEVVMHSPAKGRHLAASGDLFTLLNTWVSLKSLGKVYTEKALVALTRNDYEPDICFWGPEKAADFEDDTMRHPAPDLVVEVLSKTTEQRDRGIKYEDYAAHGVQEYWIIDPYAQTVETYLLDREFMQYEATGNLTVKDSLRSQVVAGFEIPVRAIFEKELFKQTLQRLVGE